MVASLRPYSPERIILFGSYARGDQDTFSDLDIVVIKETEERSLVRLAAVYQHVQPDYALDALVYTLEEFAAMAAKGNPLIERAQREGIVLYERPRVGIVKVAATG